MEKFYLNEEYDLPEQIISLIEKFLSENANIIYNIKNYDFIKYTTFILYKISNFERNYPKILKTATNLLLNNAVKTLNDRLNNEQTNRNSNIQRSANVYELLIDDALNAKYQENWLPELLAKWWVNYISVLNEFFLKKKNSAELNNQNEIWWSTNDKEYLKNSLNFLVEKPHYRFLIIEVCMKYQDFFQIHELFNFEEEFIRIKEDFLKKIQNEIGKLAKNDDKNMKKNYLKEILDKLEKFLQKEESKDSILSGKFNKTVTACAHTIIRGDDGGLYASWKKIDEHLEAILLEEDYLDIEYIKFLVKGSLGPIQLGINLIENEFSSNLIESGTILFIKKGSIRKKFTMKDIREIAWNDFSRGELEKLLYSPLVYDFKIIENQQKIKSYIFRQFEQIYDSETILCGENRRFVCQKYYFKSLFEDYIKLLEKGLCIPTLKPEKIIYNEEKRKGMILDLSGAVIKSNENQLEKCYLKEITEISKKYTAPELKQVEISENPAIKVNLIQASSYNLGQILKKIIKKEGDEELKQKVKELRRSLVEENPENRISLEKALDILIKIDSENISKTFNFSNFIKNLKLEKPEKFGLKSHIFNEDRIIKLSACSFDPEQYDNIEIEDLNDTFIKFLEENQKVFVLIGPIGSGKSHFIQINYFNALRDWKKGDPIPLYMNLAFEEDLKERWEWICNEIGLEYDPSFFLKRMCDHSFLLFLDNFDQIPTKTNLVGKFLKELDENKMNKCVISCRNEQIFNGNELKKWFKPTQGSIKTAYILNLNKANFDYQNYFKFFVKKYDKIENEQLLEIMKTPHIVNLCCEILENMEKKEKISLINIYKLYIKEKIKRYYYFKNADIQSSKLCEIIKTNNKNLQNIVDYESFVKSIQTCAINIARNLHKYEGNSLNMKAMFPEFNYQNNHSIYKNKELLLMISSLDLVLFVKGKVPNEQIKLSFSHESFKSYFLSKQIIKECKKYKISATLNYRLLTDNELILYFLSENLKRKQFFKECLIEIVRKSKNFPQYSIASANAITILTAGDVSLAGENFSHIKIPHANLRNEVLNYCNFSGADLTGVNFKNCHINDVSFENAHLKDIVLADSSKLFCICAVWSCCFSPDENIFLVGFEDGTIKLFNTYTGNTLETYKEHNDKVFSIAFSSDGNIFISGGGDKKIIIWNKNPKELLKILEGHKNNIRSVAFSCDNKKIVSGSEDKTIKIWETSTGNLITTVETPNNSEIKSISLSSDGNFLVAAAYKMIFLWNQDGKYLKFFEGHHDYVNSVAVSPDCQSFISGSSDKTIILWDLISTNEKNIKYICKGHTNWVMSVVFSTDGSVIISGSADKTIKFWSYFSGQLLKTLIGHSRNVNCIDSSSDFSTILSGSDDQTIRIWRKKSNNSFKKSIGAYDPVNCVAISPDNSLILSACGKIIKLWDREFGSLKKIFEGHIDNINSIVFSPDGKYFLSASKDFRVKLWELETGKILKTFEHQDIALMAVFSPLFQKNGEFASCSKDSNIIIWSKDTDSKPIKKFPGVKTVNCLAFSRGGDYLISGSSDDFNNIKLWDVKIGTIDKSFIGHLKPVLCVIFSENGKYIASGSEDNMMILWNLQGDCVKIFRGHTNKILSINFVKIESNLFIMSGCHDKSMKLWSIDEKIGEALQTFNEHSDSVRCIALAKEDSVFMVSGSYDKTVKIWMRKNKKSKKIQWICCRTIAQKENELSCKGLIVNDKDISAFDKELFKEKGAKILIAEEKNHENKKKCSVVSIYPQLKANENTQHQDLFKKNSQSFEENKSNNSPKRKSDKDLDEKQFTISKKELSKDSPQQMRETIDQDKYKEVQGSELKNSLSYDRMKIDEIENSKISIQNGKNFENTNVELSKNSSKLIMETNIQDKYQISKEFQSSELKNSFSKSNEYSKILIQNDQNGKNFENKNVAQNESGGMKVLKEERESIHNQEHKVNIELTIQGKNDKEKEENRFIDEKKVEADEKKKWTKFKKNKCSNICSNSCFLI